jgi:hypothetical protein
MKMRVSMMLARALLEGGRSGGVKRQPGAMGCGVVHDQAAVAMGVRVTW